MGTPFEITPQQEERLKGDTKQGNAFDTIKVLEEIGPCGWGSASAKLGADFKQDSYNHVSLILAPRFEVSGAKTEDVHLDVYRVRQLLTSPGIAAEVVPFGTTKRFPACENAE
jgi:hypothetical protein